MSLNWDFRRGSEERPWKALIAKPCIDKKWPESGGTRRGGDQRGAKPQRGKQMQNLPWAACDSGERRGEYNKLECGERQEREPGVMSHLKPDML